MANEITINLSAQLANGQLTDSVGPKRMQIDQSDQGKFDATLLFSTNVSYCNASDSGITFGIATIANLSTASDVKVGVSDGAGSGVFFLNIKAQEAFVFRLNNLLDSSTDLAFQAYAEGGAGLIRFQLWAE